jgi:hypothetical protein
MAAALKEIATQGEPLTAVVPGTSGRLAKFTGTTRLGDSLVVETDTMVEVEGTLIAVDQGVHGTLTVGLGTNQIIITHAGGSGTDPTISFRTAQNLRALVGVASAVDRLVIGSVEGDLVLRVQPGGSLKVAVNAGTLVHFKVDVTGIDHIGVHKIHGVQVLTTRRTGYVQMTGTSNRGTVFDTATITNAQLAQRVKAMQDDLMTHGAFGA